MIEQTLGEFIKVELDRRLDPETVPFKAASRTFYDGMCGLFKDLGYVVPTWAVWLDIRGMLLSDQRINGIKLLRASVYRGVTEEPVPPGNANPSTEFTKYVLRQCTAIRRVPLELKEAKAVLDWLLHNEKVFDRVPSDTQG